MSVITETKFKIQTNTKHMLQIQTLLAHSPVVAVPMAGVASTAGPPVARTLGVHLVARHPSSLPNHSRAQKLSFFQASLRSSCGRHPAWATGWCPLGCSSAHSAAQSSKRTAAAQSSSALRASHTRHNHHLRCYCCCFANSVII